MPRRTRETRRAAPSGRDDGAELDALEVITARAKELSTCLQGTRGTVPTWLEVDALGRVGGVRFGSGVDSSQADCTRKALEGVVVTTRGPETLYVELRAR